MIELDRKYNPENTGTEFDQDLLNSLPLPVYATYKLLESQTDNEKSLQILCLSLIPWSCQYIALILSGEYLETKDEPSFEVTNSLLNMIKKPGPGKWIGFARAATEYFTSHETAVIPREAIDSLNRLLNGKNKPQAKVSENEDRLDYTDALISVRNRFAHSRSFTEDKAYELFKDHFLIWKALIVIIKDVFSPRLLYRSSQGGPVYAFDKRPLDTIKLSFDLEYNSTLLFNGDKNSIIKLYPIIVNYSEDQKKDGEPAFLEEIRNKYLFYLQGDSFFKLKNEFEIFSKMIDSKTIREEEVTAGSLTLNTFGERIDRITNQTITEFKDALKYIPEIYLERPSINENLDKWIEGNLPSCIIAGNPGTGKTSLITNWCIHRKTKGDNVLLFEASGLKESDIISIIEKELNLSSPLKDCLDTIKKLNIELQGTEDPKRFILVIDAINEFTGTNNESRSRLWREIDNLIGIMNLYSPYFKCLVTTRSDLWSVDFPEKNSASDMLKAKLYWGEIKNGFPRIILGDLTQHEAEQIYDKARTSIPSMAVLNTFYQLTEKTRQILCNPFFLRLALITYNGTNVPNLTKSRLEKQFAQEKIIEKEDKKKVLFALLERMSALRKTEVTVDELLLADTNLKSKKKVSEKEKQYLEKLIYDPRPQSSYKKLIREGIIEEKTDNLKIECKEKIRFSQEKITDLIYAEFKNRDYKRRKLIILVTGIIILIPVLITIIASIFIISSAESIIEKKLAGYIIEREHFNQITAIATEIIKKAEQVKTIRISILESIVFIIGAVLFLLDLYTKFLASRYIKNDLPSKFIKEKFTDMKEKKVINGIPLALLLIIIACGVWGENDINKLAAFILICIVFYSYIGEVAIGIAVVLQNANSPQDSFSILGKSQVITSCLNSWTVILTAIIMYIFMPYIPDLIDINTNSRIISLKQEWSSNESVILLKNNNPEIFSDINKILSKKTAPIIENPEKYISVAVRSFIYSIAIFIPVNIILSYLFGSIIFKILKRRFYG